jgi:hypothetical protein
VKNVRILAVIALLTTGLLAVPHASAQTFPVLAIGTLDQSRAGQFQDLSGLTSPLENGVRGNELGGFGSALTWASGDTFLALPDRGPNAVPYDSNIDDTVTYISRFHTIEMRLDRNTSGTGLPFSLVPHLKDTTLLWNAAPLFYGTGDGQVGSGVPSLNRVHRHYFTGRSDGFDPNHDSGDPYDARFDTEGIRVSNDGRSVFISDEYGPYIYQFDRRTGERLRSFRLPDSFYVDNLSSVGKTEISGNTSGRTANKGMEGIAITPDGRTLVGIMQNALIQDANEKGDAANLLRIAVIDIQSGRMKHEYGYLLTSGSGVSEILALNNHEFLVDERDGHGRADGSNAKVKQLFKIDLNGATDIRDMDGTTAAMNTIPKTLFFDLVKSLTAVGVTAGDIPAKIEGISFGKDIWSGGARQHTLWVANDNDFLETVPDANGAEIPNPNQIFVFAFTDADLAGSKLVLQKFDDSDRHDDHR